MKPVILVIMDGVGYREEEFGNAVLNAKTPNLDYLRDNYPYTLIYAHGKYVGLPSCDDMGNSEVGHNTLGCGQIYSQGAKLVNDSIENDTLYSSATWKKLVDYCKDNHTMHFIGLLSDGNVHSHINHLLSMLEQSKKEGIQNVRIHILLDGRDVLPTSALEYVSILERKINELNDDNFNACIASGGGRMEITMDRYEANWSMVEKGWQTHVLANGRHFKSAKEAIETYRIENPNIIDQYLPPFVITNEEDTPIGPIKDHDSVIFFNFRGDRALEISQAFDDDNFNKFDLVNKPNVLYAGMLQYDADRKIPKNFIVEPPKIENTLTEELCKHNIHEYAISETQKYGHVTYFWNGNRQDKFNDELETYELVPSLNIPFEEQPKMKAYEITEKLIEAIKSNKYEFLRCNYPNGDMIGHTGLYEKVVTAIETIDECLGKVIKACDEVSGTLIVLADHGNAEMMYQEKNLEKKVPNTSHTTNPVPLYIYSNEKVNLKSGDFGLANIASTICDLMNIEPNTKWKESIIKKD